MAYRNTIISLVSVVALGTACSKAPNYNSDVQKGAADQQAAVDTSTGHGPMPQDDDAKPVTTADNTKTDTTAPATKPADTTTPPPATNTAIVADPVKKMANLAMFNMINITNAQGWGTSAAAPLKFQVATDATGALPAGDKLAVQYLAKIDATDPNKITLTDKQGAAAALTKLNSFLVVCNNSAANIYLHSDGTGVAPFSHGNGSVAAGACGAFPVQNLTTPAAGKTYDHLAGNKAENFIYMQIEKVGPDGKVIP